MRLRSLQAIWDFIKPFRWSLAFCAVTAVVALAAAYAIIWPAYQNPISRMYSSKIGYAGVIRKSGGAFPVRVARVSTRRIVGKFIGEGLTQSEPVQVPMIAMARIDKVNAIEGQLVRAGDVIVELDRTKLDFKIESARAALETAKAERERVQLGTVNVLQEERPDLLELRAKTAAAEAEVSKQLVQIREKLFQNDAISEVEVLASRLEALRAELQAKEKKIAAEVALAGRESSLRIAESAIREAEMTLKHRLSEVDDYTAKSPADGIVERVLVHAGEYNQDPGRPAVLLASGLWFECYLDQTALGRVHVGDRAELRLSAYQDHVFSGRITHVRSLVNFALGGPETNRPIRPLGTGAPEWPSTFAVRIEVDHDGHLIVPGQTGYASVIMQKDATAVPRSAVSAVSGNRAIVFVVGKDGVSFEPRNVVTGIRDDEWQEVREGLREGEIVIADGYQVLEPGDRITISPEESSLVDQCPRDAEKGRQKLDATAPSRHHFHCDLKSASDAMSYDCDSFAPSAANNGICKQAAAPSQVANCSSTTEGIVSGAGQGEEATDVAKAP